MKFLKVLSCKSNNGVTLLFSSHIVVLFTDQCKVINQWFTLDFGIIKPRLKSWLYQVYFESFKKAIYIHFLIPLMFKTCTRLYSVCLSDDVMCNKSLFPYVSIGVGERQSGTWL